ncbi:uracil-DNA glycosylase [Algibacter mikhailovii]|uniref:Uracil-DNA glycosylase n=1 Tax=Algibacter mikhailovii TaxID=425498 RepID=A0A918QSS6_9FLAO|nr:uracil-DNA glycosylase [Algibacter mikhailovii]GGZ68640.1 uracil-DNA glycosylase 2 [Algibacter mikhailovii]
MEHTIHDSWKSVLQGEFSKPYFKTLNEFVKKEYQNHQCFPPIDQVFSAFNYCPFNAVKVVLIGQDPYHDYGQANGLCFSVNEGIKHPPSLVNIFKELSSDLNMPYPQDGDLTRWAKQGVLLLNATLTVKAHEAGSHQKKGWEIFTDAVIKSISDHKEEVVFLLWGGYAKKKIKLIDEKKHKVLLSGHPSPLSANRGYWFGNKHFSESNHLLRAYGKSTISW